MTQRDIRRRLYLVETRPDPLLRLIKPSAMPSPEEPRRCECEENGGPCRCWVKWDDEGYE